MFGPVAKAGCGHFSPPAFGVTASKREAVPDNEHNRSESVDRTIAAMGLTVLKTPLRAPQANAFCERLIGTIRRECLDFVIQLMSATCETCFRSGWLITIAGVRTRVLVQAFPTRRTTASRQCPATIRFAMVIESSRSRFSAGCTTSIVSSRWPHEPTGNRREFLRRTGEYARHHMGDTSALRRPHANVE